METVSKTHNENGDVAFQTSKGLVVNQGVRPIKSGQEFNHLIDTSKVKFTSTFQEGSVDDTVTIMCEIIKEHHLQVKDLATSLKKNTRIATLQSIWDFVFNHIQYKRDKQGVEQLSTPARIWLNRSTPNTPSDCDDHSLFVGSILYCLGIPFTIRIAGYEGKTFSHVYVVAGDVCMDTVLHRFNCEAEYTSKKDRKMQIETLQGADTNPANVGVLGALNELSNSAEMYDNTMEQVYANEALNGIEGSQVSAEESALRLLGKNQLGITLKEYALDPEKYHALGFGRRYWEHMKAAFNSLLKGESLDGIIIQLTDGAEWERQNLSPLNGMALEGGETIGMFGALEGFFKKFRRRMKKLGRKVRKGIKKAAKFVAKGFKKVAKFMMKINPINIAIRAVLRSRIKNNKKGMALKMGYGLLSSVQAKQLGISDKDYQAARRAYSKFAKKYKFLGGRESKLRKVLAAAWQKAAKKANLPSMPLAGLSAISELGTLEGRRSRRRKRRRRKRALARRLAAKRRIPKRRPVRSAKPMSRYAKERLNFLKLVHKDIADVELKGLGVVVAAGTAAVAAKVAIILVPIMKLLKAVGLDKVVKKMKEKRIENLSERIVNEPDPEKKAVLERKKAKAENNLVIFNKVTQKKKKPLVKSQIPSPRNITSSETGSNDKPIYKVGTGENNLIQPMTNGSTKQAGMSPFAIGALILVGGGLLYGANKKSDNNTKKK